ATEEAFRALETLKREGKIRSIGVSNFGVRQMEEALASGVQIDVNEMPYNLFSRAIEESILPFCLRNNIGIVGSMALQQGVLAGIYKSADQVPHNQAHSRHFHHNGPGAETEMFEALERLRSKAAGMHVTLPQLAIAWVIHRNGIASTLVGARNPSEFQENLKALDLRLTEADIAWLDDATQPVLAKIGTNPDYYESAENSRIW
ncbi:MAG TPA: aldo/keto reductase, partial [Clostridia bacterium]|nr:aldo/keto reductase [Clostridia bacterium]